MPKTTFAVPVTARAAGCAFRTSAAAGLTSRAQPDSGADSATVLYQRLHTSITDAALEEEPA